eukprot:200794-Chlamydomonas_euryale.AAC.1
MRAGPRPPQDGTRSHHVPHTPRPTPHVAHAPCAQALSAAAPSRLLALLEHCGRRGVADGPPGGGAGSRSDAVLTVLAVEVLTEMAAPGMHAGKVRGLPGRLFGCSPSWFPGGLPWWAALLVVGCLASGGLPC